MNSAGDYRKPIDIEQETGSTADGMGNTYKAWSALYSGVLAAVEPLTAREQWVAERAQSGVTHRVRFRWLSGITSGMRVKFGSRILLIEGVMNPDEMDGELVLTCTEAG